MMSFVRSICVLMANSGLAPILKSGFGGVEKMLSGKKFPQNMRALRLTVEELLRGTFMSEGIHDYECLMSILEEKANASRTVLKTVCALSEPLHIPKKY